MLKDSKCIVFKVGTSTLIHPTGKTNIKTIEALVAVLSDLMNSGRRVVLVSSGAIGVGVGKLGLKERPVDTAGKQAASMIGQCELMFMYDKMFTQYGHNVGQILITKSEINDTERRNNLLQTFEKLFEYGAIPIINENDAVAVEEIVYGDNDCLSAIVATLLEADSLVILTETDGLYSGNPQDDPDARRIPVVEEITDEIRTLAGKTGSSFGTGGMVTKLLAAEIATRCGIDTYVLSGKDPGRIHELMSGGDVGTYFKAVK